MSLTREQVSRVLHKLQHVAQILDIQKKRNKLCEWAHETTIKSMKEGNMSEELKLDVQKHMGQRCEICILHTGLLIDALDLLASDITGMMEGNGNDI